MDRTDPTTRAGALLLSSLVLTPDGGLAAFRERRTAGIDVALLEKARALLDAVAAAIRSEDREDWRRIERAWEILRHVAPAKPPPPREPPAKPPPRETSAAPPPSSGDLDGTALMAPLDLDEAGKRPPLPFQGQAPAPPSVALQAHPSAGETGTVDPADIAAALASPFAARLQAGDLDVDRYAAIVAFTEQGSPDKRAEVHAHYGLADEAARRALDQQMASAFRNQPALKARFEQALARWRRYRSG